MADKCLIEVKRVIKDLLTKQSDVASRLYGDVYGQTLASQNRALGLVPTAMQSIMSPADSLAIIESATKYFLSFNLPSAITPLPSENILGTKPL